MSEVRYEMISVITRMDSGQYSVTVSDGAESRHAICDDYDTAEIAVRRLAYSLKQRTSGQPAADD